MAQTTPSTGSPDAAAAAATAPDDEIIVTGTRASGITAAESAAPIKVLGEEALSHVGQPNLNQVLTQLVPSFTAESLGGDTANLTLSARLRGLSPNHVLVLVNGKRRHGTANLHVLGGPYQGGASPDLDLIPPGQIKRIEVLEDGAAAQYGSDAIAGVINIILKDSGDGGSAYATAGQTYKGDGETYAGSVNLGTKLGDSGFINLTGFYRYHNYTDRGGDDVRVTTAAGALQPSLSAAQRALYANIPGLPHVNHINGDARSRLGVISYNAGYDFGSVQAYGFGTYGRRTARAFENYRVPDRVRASPVLGVRGDLTTPGELLFNPLGFNPKEGLVEDDYAGTGGLKGEISDWKWDLSSTYGRDKDQIHTYDSANAALFVDTHFTPTDFYDGTFISSEWTSNLDITHEFDLGMATPLNLAFGAEYRKNAYQIKSGDAASIYKEGAQSYPGFQPTDAARHTRDNEALYADISVDPIEGLKLDGAVRYEHYSDFGSKVIEKLTGRYDFSPMFALRGTVSTGFRAPTLAEEYYSATNVSPTSAFVQLPANSAAAKILGFQDLKPEKSTNFSAGIVARPMDKLVMTIDAYQVQIRDRVVGSGSLYGVGGSLNSLAVRQAIAAHGNVLDPTVTFQGVSIFTNGLNTRTRGVDLTASYPFDLGDAGKVNATLAANYNKTKITKQVAPPAQLKNDTSAAIQPLFDLNATSLLESGSPRVKVVANFLYTLDKLSVNLRETLYGKTSAYYSPDGGLYTKETVGTSAILDLEVSYELTSFLTGSIGANNLTNRKPFTVGLNSNGAIADGGNVFNAPLSITPYGINGGYYYARINVNF